MEKISEKYVKFFKNVLNMYILDTYLVDLEMQLSKSLLKSTFEWLNISGERKMKMPF